MVAEQRRRATGRTRRPPLRVLDRVGGIFSE